MRVVMNNDVVATNQPFPLGNEALRKFKEGETVKIIEEMQFGDYVIESLDGSMRSFVANFEVKIENT